MGNAGGERTRVLVEAQSQASSRARRRNYRTRVDDRVGEHQVTVQTKVARNFPRSFFKTARKRCNSNVLNSMFEILAEELRATLLGNHSGISHRRGRRRPEHQRCHRQSRTPDRRHHRGRGPFGPRPLDAAVRPHQPGQPSQTGSATASHSYSQMAPQK